jgi:hypothetical protein
MFDELVKKSEIVSDVIPAEVPRQARDPEFVERAGIQCNEALKTKKAPQNSSRDAFVARPSQ